jgi:hypothetical protein
MKRWNGSRYGKTTPAHALVALPGGRGFAISTRLACATASRRGYPDAADVPFRLQKAEVEIQLVQPRVRSEHITSAMPSMLLKLT